MVEESGRSADLDTCGRSMELGSMAVIFRRVCLSTLSF